MTELTEAEIERLCQTLAATAPGDLGPWLAAVRDLIDARLAPIRALLDDGPDTWEGYDTRDIGPAFLKESVWEFTADLYAALSAHESAPQPTSGTLGQS